MSALDTPELAVVPTDAGASVVAPDAEFLSPNQRAWRRFKRHRLGMWSLWIFAAMFALSLVAEVLSNDVPLVARYNGKLYFPLLDNPPEVEFGGDFRTPTDWSDPFIAARFAQAGNWAIHPPKPVVAVWRCRGRRPR